MNQDDDVINYFQSMSTDEQNKLKPDEMKLISDAMNRQLQKKQPNQSEEPKQDWNDSKGSHELKKSNVENMVDRYQTDNTNVLKAGGNALKSFGNAVLGGNAGRILGKANELSGGDDTTEEENKSFTDAANKPGGTFGSVMGGFASPGGKAVQSGLAASSAYNAAEANKNEDPGMAALKSGGLTYAAGTALEKAAPVVGKFMSDKVRPILDRIGTRQIAEFLGLPELEVAKMNASGHLDDFISLLREHGVLAPAQSRTQSLYNGVDALENNLGPKLGKEIENLPNMHNNEVSQMFDQAANSQDMTGIQDQFSKPKLNAEAERWANRKGMTSYDPNNNVAIEGDKPQWVSGEPVQESMNAPNVTAGNPTGGVDGDPIWQQTENIPIEDAVYNHLNEGETVPRSGITVPEVTAPHLHNERKAIDDRLYQSTQPAGGAIKSQEAQGLQDARDVYSAALDRQAERAGRSNEYSKANQDYSDVAKANSGLSAMTKNIGKAGSEFTRPIKMVIDQGRSSVGLGAKDLAAMIARSPNLMSHVDGAKIGRIAQMIMQSDQPDVDHEIMTSVDPEYNRFVLDMQKQTAEANQSKSR